MSKPKFVDLGGPHGLAEDQRITMIGNKAMLGEKVGVLIDGDKHEPGKVDRYIAKVLERFPGVEVTFRGPYFRDESVVAVTFERKRN